MRKKPSDTAITAWTRLLTAGRSSLEAIEADLKRHRLPSLRWYDVLLELAREPSGQLRQFELGEQLLLSKYNLSRLLDRMAGDGVVRRQICPEDGRGHLVIITVKGRRLLKKMWPVYGQGIERYFARHYSVKELKHLADLLTRSKGE
jgi:DNA-binding MarR family transcriptional regulator